MLPGGQLIISGPDALDNLYFAGELLEQAAELLLSMSKEEAEDLRSQARRYKDMAGVRE